MVGGKFEIRWCGSEFRQTTTVSDKELGDLFVRAVGLENLLVDARQEILAEPADGLRGAENGPADAGFVEPDQGAVAFLDFDDAVLNGHSAATIQQAPPVTMRFDVPATALRQPSSHRLAQFRFGRAVTGSGRSGPAEFGPGEIFNGLAAALVAAGWEGPRSRAHLLSCGGQRE